MIYPCPKGSKENERNTDKAPFRAGGDFEFFFKIPACRQAGTIFNF
jgi:hypothetical protein